MYLGFYKVTYCISQVRIFHLCVVRVLASSYFCKLTTTPSGGTFETKVTKVTCSLEVPACNLKHYHQHHHCHSQLFELLYKNLVLFPISNIFVSQNESFPLKSSVRIPTVKLKIPGKAFLKYKSSLLCPKLYLPTAAIGR